MAEREYEIGYGKPPRAHQFKKGEPNPGGRSKKISAIYGRRLLEVDPDDPAKRLRGEVLFDALYREAKKGNVQAIKEITDRVEGKARQTLSITDDRREQLEQQIENFMADAEAAGEPVTREQAIALLRPSCPELEYLH